MPQLELFDTPDPLPPQAARLAPRLHALAGRGVHFGTSSWKYPGWVGSIYTPERYQVRGKFSERRFNDECLAEYARTFPVVGGDFSFYQFPSADFWARLFDTTPDSLLFGLKAPEDLTVQSWPRHARYGARAGQPNASFLDPDLLRRAFLANLEPYRHRVAVVMLEFGTFPRSIFPTAAAFIDRLDPFLAAIPPGIRLAVEIRNPEYLDRPYLDTLASHNVAHVFNAWTRMPALDEQVEIPGAFTADFAVSRCLLPRGRSYEAAVAALEPYTRIQEPSEPTRAGMRKLVYRALKHNEPVYLFVNNRLEGNAPGTIEAVIDPFDL